MFVDELLLVSLTTLRTTEKKFDLGRQRIELCLYLQLGGFTVNRISAILALQYKHIMVTLLRDPAGGPHRLLLEFTFEFTKEYLGMKEAWVSFPYFFSPHETSTGEVESGLVLTRA